MSMFIVAVICSLLISVQAQRSPYAGSRPGSGYKDRFSTTSVSSSSSTGGTINPNDIGDRVGEGSTTASLGTSTASLGASTDRLPYDAYGDKFIVDHWNSVPADQRPFWILNQAHIEKQRGTPSDSTSTTQSVNSGVVDRFDGVTTPNQARPISNNFNANDQNVFSLQEIVLPSNLTPEQRNQMEIQILKDRLEALERRKQSQPQQNPPNQRSTF